MSDTGRVYREAIEVTNALQIARPTLGGETGIELFRMLRLVAYEDIMGKAAGGIVYYAGKKLGRSLGLTSLEEFLELCKQQKIGIIEVPTMKPTQIQVNVYECATCSGLTPVGRTLCHFEGGLIAGAVESILKKKIRARETTCIGGLGHDCCGFDLEVIDEPLPNDLA